MIDLLNLSRTVQPMAVRLMAAACIAPWLMTSLYAQQAMPPATGATTTFPIRGFELQGEIPLSSDETTRILAPYIRQDGNLVTLQQAGAALEAALKDKGYALHRVTLPPQEVGAKVMFNVVKFVIGKVTVEGKGDLSEANVRRSCPNCAKAKHPISRHWQFRRPLPTKTRANRFRCR